MPLDVWADLELSTASSAAITRAEIVAERRLRTSVSPLRSANRHQILLALVTWASKSLLTYARELGKTAVANGRDVSRIAAECERRLRALVYQLHSGAGVPLLQQVWPRSPETCFHDVWTALQGRPEWDRILNVIDGAARAQRAATKPVATRRPTSKLTQDETSERRAVDEFLRHANQTSGRRILKKDIWQAARYRDQSQFLMFQAGRASDSVAERFRQILDRDPGEFAQERRKPRKPPTTIS